MDESTDQWLPALRAMRSPGTARFHLDLLNTLIDNDLVRMNGLVPELTARGRDVLVRGSPKLWQDAA